MSTFLTEPAVRAVMAVSIFIASMMRSTWFSSTLSPGWTLTFETMPGMEEPTCFGSSSSASTA